MAKTNKADMSCARVKQYTAFDVSKAERHNERKNETYENMNVITERIALNVHFKKPTVPTYMEQLKQMETDGLVSLRGLRKDATLFDEIVIDVNTMYFERNGGYEYAKHFLCSPLWNTPLSGSVVDSATIFSFPDAQGPSSSSSFFSGFFPCAARSASISSSSCS